MNRRQSARRYSSHTLKVLWGRAAGRCAVPDCRVDLIVDATDYDPIVVIGDIGHIEASSDHGPRANRELSIQARDSYDNLILLCKNCHCRFDAQKKTNTVAAIKALRAAHEAWVRASLPERGRSTNGWKLLVLQGQHPIDAAQTVAALSPDYPASPAVVLDVSPTKPWTKTIGKIRAAVGRLLAEGDPFDCRFAVFPLAPVSACLAIGFVLTSRPRVRIFHQQRSNGSWTWQNKKFEPTKFKISGLPRRIARRAGDVAVCFHLSARIQHSDIPGWRSMLGTVDVAVPEQTVDWLKSPGQLDALGETAIEVFGRLRQVFPNARRWHLFFAGPAAGAVKVGQQLNPSMNPPVQLYEFKRTGSPRYTASLCLTGEVACPL